MDGDFRRQVWGENTFVDFEHGLNFCIRQIREALQDNAGHPQFIQTIPRRGYCFVAPVEEISKAAVATSVSPEVARKPPIPSRWWARLTVLVTVALLAMFVAFSLWKSSRSPRIRSIAVLPLTNLSGDPNQDYFVDGMTEALITNLSKVKELNVISRTSVMQYKGVKKPLPQVARELGVEAVIEGSVVRSGARLRITAQLINAANDMHLWADTFDRDSRDVLALQSEVARAIAEQVRGAISPDEHQQLASAAPVNLEAHEHYLKGRYYWWKRTPADMTKAIEEFQYAITTDPNYALAYAGLADAFSSSANNGFQAPAEGNEKAKAAALRAVELNESLPEAHVALGRVYRNYEWDWKSAETEYRRAIALNPSFADAYLAYSNLLSFLGRHDEAVSANRRAQQLDPLASRINAHLAYVLYNARRYDEAILASNKALQLSPDDPYVHIVLGRIYFQQHKFSDAVAQMEPFRNSSNAQTSALGPAYVAAGRSADARRLLAEMSATSKVQYISPYSLAVAHLGVTTSDSVFGWLEKCFEQRDPLFPTIRTDPVWDPLRSDPRFNELVRRLGLQPMSTGAQM